MAPVNGCQHPDCEDPAHDSSNSHLLGPHGSEWQDTVSATGAGSGGTAAWGPKVSTIHQTSLISTPSGTQDGIRQSIPLRTHCTHYEPVSERQSFISNSFVSLTISFSHLPSIKLLFRTSSPIVQRLRLFTSVDNNQSALFALFVQ
jgi:hypothetical protein